MRGALEALVLAEFSKAGLLKGEAGKIASPILYNRR